MKKYLAYIALGTVFVAGVVLVAYFGIQPQPVRLIKLSHFESTKVAANSVLLRLRQELQMTPVLIWGVDSSQADAFSLLQEFQSLNQDPATSYSVVIVDRDLEGHIPELKQFAGERIQSSTEIARLREGLQQFVQQGLRVMVIMPAPFAAGLLDGSPARQLRDSGLPMKSILLLKFPRTREQEKEMAIPCDVADHDLSGTGRLGCQILQTGRLNYRKKMKPGDLVGLMSQISSTDYALFLNREPSGN